MFLAQLGCGCVDRTGKGTCPTVVATTFVLYHLSRGRFIREAQEGGPPRHELCNGHGGASATRKESSLVFWVFDVRSLDHQVALIVTKCRRTTNMYT
jgi:hypothetical protein